MKNSSILMKSANRISKVVLALIVIMLCLAGCVNNPATSATGDTGNSLFDDMPDSASSIPAVVTASKDPVMEGGEYSYTGERNEAIVIYAPEQEVTLNLNNARIEPVSGPAIRIVEAGRVTVVVPENTQSSIIDSSKYEADDNAQGALYSQSDVIITGGGTLNVNGYYKNGIQCKDRVSINDMTVNITAKGDGIRANDGIEINDAIINCESERHGLVTRKEGKDDKGNIKITKSDVSIIAGGFGVRCKTDLIMDAVKMNINAVLGQFDVTGESYIGEGCIINE